jgi:hypothetical protein
LGDGPFDTGLDEPRCLEPKLLELLLAAKAHDPADPGCGKRGANYNDNQHGGQYRRAADMAPAVFWPRGIRENLSDCVSSRHRQPICTLSRTR